MTSISTPAACDARTASFTLHNRAVLIFASVLIFLPSALFAAGLRPIPALVLLAGCIGSLALVSQRPRANEGGLLDAPVDLKRLSLCIGLACVILVFGGELHFFFAPLDWRVRDAVLADLTRSSFPIGYTIDGVDYTLRAPLGMYMFPAAVGHVFGLLGAHVALLAQNSLMLGCIFYLLSSLGAGWPHLAILIMFGGLSILGAALGFAISKDYKIDRLVILGLDAWHPYFQYSSSMVQFFWVPNHALPGWWLATLLLLQTRSQVDIATLGVSLAGAVFWSPLVVIPVAFWLIYLAATDWRRHLLAQRTWLGVLAGACFLPIALYVVIGSSQISHGLSFEKMEFIPLYIIFIAVELPCVCFIYLNREFIPKNMTHVFYFGAASLLLLPFFSFGPGNDLVMRGSTAPLVIVAFVFGSIICNASISRNTKLIGFALIVLSTPSALLEFARNINYPRYNLSDCSLTEAIHAMGAKGIPTNYIVESANIPSWLIDANASAPQSARSRRCWTDFDNRHD